MPSKQFALVGMSSRNLVMPLTNSNSRSVLSTNKQMKMGRSMATTNNFTPWNRSNTPITPLRPQNVSIASSFQTGTTMSRSYGWKPNPQRGYVRAEGGCRSCGGAR